MIPREATQNDETSLCGYRTPTYLKPVTKRGPLPPLRVEKLQHLSPLTVSVYDVHYGQIQWAT